MSYKEVEGDLIKLAKLGNFEVIVHGCNCFCRMKSGVAPQMAEAFGCNEFPLEQKYYEDVYEEKFLTHNEGNINKLGQIDFKEIHIDNNLHWSLIVVNAYTQYKIKKFNDFDYPYTTTENPFDYAAFTLCMRKINHTFKKQHVGMPKIGSHLAGGDWSIIKKIIQNELKDCDVTIVIYKP